MFLSAAPDKPHVCQTWCYALRQNHPKRESTGTGFVVHDRLILTNAHVVADSTYVLVKRHGSGTKFKAGVHSTRRGTGNGEKGRRAGRRRRI